ncbi:hypothetical protein D8M04_18890 [Oceanobacillus piezotolerans]|uniref:Uncharacterized protein n=1 Tax=Oceanobacillus piezotolerans TaxID=2448030 RepID=A0A498D1I1_9BACI|nr:hypothetical protein D8M04_18890 [Oceanobacillus piezotolerans]
MLLRLENEQDVEYLNAPHLISCPTNGYDQERLFLLDFKNSASAKLDTGSFSEFTLLKNKIKFFR